MAWMNQERKRAINANLKKVAKKYGIKYSLAVRNHSTIVMNIKSGPLDFRKDMVTSWNGHEYKVPEVYSLDINPYWYREHFKGKSKNFLTEAFAVLNEGNHDNSDPMTDYFDVGWYVDMNVGKWNKPYELTK